MHSRSGDWFGASPAHAPVTPAEKCVCICVCGAVATGDEAAMMAPMPGYAAGMAPVAYAYPPEYTMPGACGAAALWQQHHQIGRCQH